LIKKLLTVDYDILGSKMKLFGSSGIRGVMNQEITSELALRVGEVIGSMYDRVIMGYDPRTSNHLALSALTSGLLSAGGRAYHAGLTTTPTLAHAARNFDCGLMITASHNPPEYNGIKFFNPDGSGFGFDQMQAIEDMFFEGGTRTSGWQDIRGVSTYENAVSEHMDSIRKMISPLDLKVVVDCGCGAASNITPFLLRQLGCRVITLNSQPDGFFPGRGSEPSKENIQSLISSVVSVNADLGIAHDGDADRVVAVDEKGNYVGGDPLLVLFAKHEVKNSIVVPVNASMAISTVVGSAEVIYTKVGDVFISESIKKNRSDFGGEPSGTFIFPKHNLCPDGIFAACRLAELVCKEPLSEQVSDLPRYPRKKGTFACPNNTKSIFMSSIATRLIEINPVKVSTQDGIRIQFDSSWALIRPSGTEPKIRITVEATDDVVVEDLYEKIILISRECVTQ
jgi:phosphoglucosamine mutase